LCPLEDNVWEFLSQVLQVGPVQLLGLLAQQADLDGDARLFEDAEATAGHKFIGVGHGDDHAFDSGAKQGVRARRRLPMMATWFKRYVARGSVERVFGAAQRVDFGVRSAESPVKSFGEHVVAPGEDAADHWVRLDTPLALPGERQGTLHVERVRI
jgi:hypothetical protein